MTGYSSPFSDRYGTETMRGAWSRAERLRVMSAIWTRHHNKLADLGNLPLAKTADPYTKLTDEEMEKIVAQVDAMEKITGHDVVAMLKVYEDHLPIGISSMAHAGLTSSDVLDQAILMQTLFSFYDTWRGVRGLVSKLCLAKNADTKWLMGRTHLQPAEPTTLQHRFLLYAQDLAAWLDQGEIVIEELDRYRGVMSGSVGNYANEVYALGAFTHHPFPGDKDRRAKSQTLPRSLDLWVAQSLTGLAAILHKMSFDYRLESGFGNVYDKAAGDRIGSSAMPYKRNPITAEAIDSLARHIRYLCSNSWDNTAWQGLDRTLDDSANRRAWLPEAFLATSEIVRRTNMLLNDYTQIDEVSPGMWNDLWQQARDKAFAVTSAAVTVAGHPKLDPVPSGLERVFGEYMDNKIFKELMVRNNRTPAWFEHFNVSAPHDWVWLA